jgi:hypothetical protein
MGCAEVGWMGWCAAGWHRQILCDAVWLVCCLTGWLSSGRDWLPGWWSLWLCRPFGAVVGRRPARLTYRLARCAATWDILSHLARRSHTVVAGSA